MNDLSHRPVDDAITSSRSTHDEPRQLADAPLDTGVTRVEEAGRAAPRVDDGSGLDRTRIEVAEH